MLHQDFSWWSFYFMPIPKGYISFYICSMAIILNIETATTNCSVSIAENGKLLALKEFNSANYSHAEQLHVFIDDVLKQAAKTNSNLDAIAVSKGPGSYTGLRIGVSAAKGLCFALDVPLISIPTLINLAHQIKPEENEAIVSVLDARRMEVYSAIFNSDFNQIKETEAKIIDEASYQEEINQFKKVHFIGPGAEKIKETLSNSNAEFWTDAIPSAKEMCQLSYKEYIAGIFEDVAYFEPYYLKDFMIQKPKASK